MVRDRRGRVRLLWRILLFLTVAFAVAVLGGALVPAELPYGTVPVLVGSLVGGWILLRQEGRDPGALGFYLSTEAVHGSVLGLGLGVGLGLLVLALITALGGLEWSGEEGTGVGYLRAGASSLWLFALPAAAEEALFRGYLLQAMAEAWGALWALVATSVLFACFHLFNPNVSGVGVGNILVAGLFLGAVYLKTASLWWATGTHLGWNWAHGFLGDVPVSGLDPVNAPFLSTTPEGAEWISGGTFGPEGSVMTTGVLALVTLAVWNSGFLRPGEAALKTRPLILYPERKA
jgi:membrane protease YdiL (CAAX protease family)